MKRTLYSFCIKGDVNAAYDYLQNINSNKETEKLKQKYYNRFYSGKPIFRYKTKDTWIKSVIKTYNEYFIFVLTNKKSRVEAEESLRENLLKLLLNYNGAKDIDSIEARLAQEFKLRGYYFLGGITPPFRGPYIWGKEEIVEYEVNLPDRTKKVKVHFMSDFIMLSWLHFATFGGRSAGGWATNNGLFCVKERYEKILNKPDFTISYLAHEAQHLADYEDYPSLCSRDLEYRAKLVELIYHPLNHKILMKKFIMDADNNRTNPHPYANFIICNNLSQMIFNQNQMSDPKEWAKVDPNTLSCCATELLQKHTDSLNNKGKQQVVSII
ncbi:hypothetical protein NST02_04875 [Robertmurraya sp. FSL W8-0741]|uniref:hypothetical protein n=1 Tax=Robertmurraya sp. FSL W8-0741 TaxID=2954629 RepID=UPI0030F4F180